MTTTIDATLDGEVLRRWLGRRREVTDTIHAAPAARLHATLDRAGAPPTVGDALPAAWHWLYFLEASPLGEAGRDGHAERGEFLPPVALPRRMWGGGRLEFSRAITIGETIKKQSTITDITPKKKDAAARYVSSPCGMNFSPATR